jgi:hypothetical protein
MEETLLKNILLLNSVCYKLNTICVDLTKINATFEEMLKQNSETPSTISSEDYE